MNVAGLDPTGLGPPPVNNGDRSMVRCSVSKGSWRCKHEFPFELAFFRGKWQPLKNCPYHRAQQRAKNKTDVGKACHKRALQSPAGKASAAKMYATQAYKDKRRERKKTPQGRECTRRSNKTPAGKARAKRNSDKQHAKIKADPARKMMHKLQCRLRDMLKANGADSVTVTNRTSIKSGSELRAHMESTFVDGMNWSNHGWRGENIWNIGHRIAITMYDWHDDADLRRCWSLPNIFAQWSLENQNASCALPSTDQLLLLRDIWPLAWNDELPTNQQRASLEKAARNAFGQTR